jgi:hypothetical protein
MADIATNKINALHTKSVEGGGLFSINTSFSITTGGGDSGDVLEILDMPMDCRIVDAIQSVSATLGASCTVRLRHDDGSTQTNICPASTAGGADVDRMSIAGLNVSKGDEIDLVIGGANIGATATISVDLICQAR